MMTEKQIEKNPGHFYVLLTFAYISFDLVEFIPPAINIDLFRVHQILVGMGYFQVVLDIFFLLEAYIQNFLGFEVIQVSRDHGQLEVEGGFFECCLLFFLFPGGQLNRADGSQ